jgi:hypothetical protein
VLGTLQRTQQSRSVTRRSRAAVANSLWDGRGRRLCRSHVTNHRALGPSGSPKKCHNGRFFRSGFSRQSHSDSGPEGFSTKYCRRRSWSARSSSPTRQAKASPQSNARQDRSLSGFASTGAAEASCCTTGAFSPSWSANGHRRWTASPPRSGPARPHPIRTPPALLGMSRATRAVAQHLS